MHGAGLAWAGGTTTGSNTDPNGPLISAALMRFALSLPGMADDGAIQLVWRGLAGSRLQLPAVATGSGQRASGPDAALAYTHFRRMPLAGSGPDVPNQVDIISTH